MMISQALGNEGWISSIIWLLLFVVMIFFYPRLMIYQVITKIEKEINDLETMENTSYKKIIKKITKKPTKELKKKIYDFMEFFIAEPVSIDPYGIANKIHEIVKLGEKREIGFVDRIAPDLDIYEKRNISTAIGATAGIHQIIKIIRYYLELIKKYKILQIALILQMQIPLIKKIAKALVKATGAFVDNAPIGDGIGPLVVASMIPENSKVYNLEEEEFSYAKTKIGGKDVILAKATGPGSSIGYPGKFVEKITKKEKIDRIITVDAAGALEGEKDGAIMEGVGIGSRGTAGALTSYHGFIIEEVATKKKIPIDSIGIKEVSENYMLPMKEEIYKSLPDVKKKIEEMVKWGKKEKKILVIGVGNTTGIGDNRKGLDKTIEIIKKKNKEMKEEEKKEKKKKGGSLFSGLGFSMFSMFAGYRTAIQQKDLENFLQRISTHR